MKTTRRSLFLKALSVIGVCLVLVFIVMQFFGPKVSNPTIAGEFHGPKAVQQLFERSCYDCHSNKTKLKWFDRIAPVSWMVAADVEKARTGLNFTEWDKLTPIQQKVSLWEAYGHIKVGGMPLKKYQILHPEAAVSVDDLDLLRRYLLSIAAKTLPDDIVKKGIARKQYHQLAAAKAPLKILPLSVNGIAYINDYRKWEVLSTSERFDNGTMRVIYGNDVAMKAVKKNQLKPWPDGSIIIKVAWSELQGTDGITTTGEFKNFQYMIKDSKKYSNTEGWGFARFDGVERKPFGDPGFDNSCINCHRAVSANDFVFTRPIKH